MSTRAAAWLAWSVWALCVALAALAIFLDFYIPPTKHDPNFQALVGVPLLVYPTIGTLVVSRHPKNAVGYILLGLGIVLEAQAFAAAYSNYALFAQPSSVPGRMIAHWVHAYAVGPSVMLGAVLLILLFPDGRLPHRELWAMVWMAVCGAALLSFW